MASVSRSTGSFALLGALAVLAGCAEDPDEALADDDLDGKRALHGWIVIERGESEGAVRTNVSAKFLQVGRAEIGIAQQLVKARPDVPPSGDCVAISSLEAPVASPSSLSVDLLDVGDVTLTIHEPATHETVIHEPETSRIVLAPRAFPNIGDLVSGVFYTSPDASLRLPMPADYEIGGTGSSVIDAFLVDVRSPEAPRDVRVDREAIDLVDTGEISNIVVRAGQDIELGWAAPADPSASLVYVDVRPDMGAAYRCTFPDGGGALLPAGLVSSSDREATLTLHRLTEHAATLRGAEDAHPATVVFDLSKSVRLTVR